MLLSHIAGGNLVSVTIHDGNAKQLLREENALGMMAKGPMTEVPEECLRFIEPVVNWQIVFRSSPEFPRAAQRVLEWVSHGYTSYVVVV
jgi:hypothetical protein